MSQGAQPQVQPSFDYLFKIVLVGDSGVGKSNLLSRFTRDVFSVDEKSTIGVEFATKTVTMSDGKRVKAQIWDTAGQERYRAVSTAYYRGALGAMLVYDATKPLTFQNIPRWLREMTDHANKDIVLLMVGNKIDVTLTGDAEKDRDAVSSFSGRLVSPSSVSDMSSSLELPSIETSAMTDYNVERAFVSVIERIYTLALANKAAAQQNREARTASQGGPGSSAGAGAGAQQSPSTLDLNQKKADDKKCCS